MRKQLSCGNLSSNSFYDILLFMKKIILGKSGLLVTKSGFGGIPIQRLRDNDAVSIVRRALELGINWFDTAHGYGSSEERIGAALKGRHNRESVYIFTKGPGKTAEDIENQIELSLNRLQTNYIDLYQFHLVRSPEEWQMLQDNGTVETVLKYRRKGIIRHIGASAHSVEAAFAVLENPEIEVLQFPFNFIAEDNGLKVLNRCRERTVGFIGMKPFAGGELNNAEVCIHYLNGFPDVAIDPGFEKTTEVGEVVKLCGDGDTLTDSDISEIKKLRATLGTRFCRRCGYCTPCPNGVEIITLMTMGSLIKRFPLEKIKNGWAARAASTVDMCIECGECEEKCPYNLPIMQGIRDGAKLFNELKSR